MRIITTSIFFDKSQVSHISYDVGTYTKDTDESLGVSFCWFKVDTSSGYGSSLESSINNIKAFRGFRPINDDIDVIIDGFIRNYSDRYFYPQENPVRNVDLVQKVLNQDIVVENSPPSLINFSKIITKSNASVVVGTYIGSAGADIHGIMLFASIPAGIIVAGSAIGIANALQNGLSSAVGRIFK